MRNIITVFIVLFLLALPVSAHAQEPAEGIIDGRVVNDTTGGGSVAGAEITLIVYIDNAIAETRTARADDEGYFQFDNVVIEHTYLISAKYMDVDYYYPVTFEAGAATAEVEVGVCDVTSSDRAIRAGVVHTVIEVEEESLLITSVRWMVNDADTTYIGSDGVLVFALPEGAYNFAAPEDLLIDFEFLEGNKVAYLVPFPPGDRELVYSYRLMKPDATEFTVPINIDYPTDSLEIIVGGENIEVAASQLAPAEPVVTSTGQRLIHYQGTDLLRDTTISIQISSLNGGGGFPLIILWLFIGAVIVGIAIYLINRKKRAGVDE